MQNLDVNVEISNQSKKGGKTAPEPQNSVAKKFLAASHMKQKMSLSFESLFIDMFAPAPTLKLAQAAEAKGPEKAAEAPVVAKAAQVETIELEAAPEAPAPVEAHDCAKEARSEDSAETSEQSAAETAESDAAEADAAETEAADTSEADVAEMETLAGDQIVTQVRILKVEISSMIRDLLSAEDIEGLVERIDALMKDEDLSVEDMVAQASSILSDLLSKLQIDFGPMQVAVHQEVRIENHSSMTDLLDEDRKMGPKEMKQFVRKFVERVRELLTDDKPAQAEAKAATDAQIEKKVDDAILKLMKKLDEPRRLEIVAPKLENAFADDKGPDEAKFEVKPAEDGRAVVAKKEKAEAAPLERAPMERTELPRFERAAESQAADLLASRAKQRATPATPVAHGLNAIAEASRAGRSNDAPAQNFWQNSYNQSSSQKGSQAASARSTAGAPQLQQSVFEQIVQNIRFVVNGGKSEASIQLKPEFLGKVDMKITVEDGKASVRFTVENNAVRAAILENVNDLKKNLTDAGLEVELVNVMLSGEFGNAQSEEEEAAREGRNSGILRADGIDEVDEEEPETAPSAVEDGSTVRYLA